MNHLVAGVDRFFSVNKITPYCVIDKERLINNYQIFNNLFGENIEIFFSVKANSHPLVLRTLKDQGSNFEVASGGEIKKMAEMGVDASRVIFSNPVKIPRDIKMAYDYGVRYFAADSIAEVHKLKKIAPQSCVYCRLEVDNQGSAWPLDKKFGANANQCVCLLKLAQENNLIPAGLTFHVGSQCTDPQSWEKAILKCARLYGELRQAGINPFLLNLGGGFPARYTKAIPDLKKIKQVIDKVIDARFDGVSKVIIEPGRAMVGNAAIMVASVIGRRVRDNKQWLFLDIGVFNGLMEAYEDLRLPVIVAPEKRNEKKCISVLAGPTCDSVDVFYENILLPRMDIGDKIIFLNAGAYTISYDRYNGYEFPGLVFEALEKKRELQVRSS